MENASDVTFFNQISSFEIYIYKFSEMDFAFRSSIPIIWDKVSKNGPSKICGRQPLKNLHGSFLSILPHIYFSNFDLVTLS